MNTFAELHEFGSRLRELIVRDASPLFDEEAFDARALELFQLQYQGNEVYRCYCDSLSKASPRAWPEIPALPVSAFKEFDVTSIPSPARTRFFQSSGTTKQTRSRHFHCEESLRVYEASALAAFEEHLLPRGRGVVRIAALTPSPAEAPHSSLVHMFETIRQSYARAGDFYFARAAADGTWILNKNAIAKLLDESIHAAAPLMLLGTAFSFVHLVDAIGETNLPAGSRVMETGGYKGQSRTVPKEELHRMITAKLGIPSANIVTEYGMSELSSQAYDKTCGATTARILKFPPWVRTRIISPENSMEAREGLLEIFDLANVYSVLAVQTEDLARTNKRNFELLGRTGAAEPRGCSLLPTAG